MIHQLYSANSIKFITFNAEAPLFQADTQAYCKVANKKPRCDCGFPRHDSPNFFLRCNLYQTKRSVVKYARFALICSYFYYRLFCSSFDLFMLIKTSYFANFYLCIIFHLKLKFPACQKLGYLISNYFTGFTCFYLFPTRLKAGLRNLTRRYCQNRHFRCLNFFLLFDFGLFQCYC